jgi:DnaJ-class molecular chaperone
VKDKYFRGLRSAALAMFLGVVLAGAVHTQAAAAGAEEGPLGKVHVAKGVKCADCHGQAKKSEPVLQEKCLSCHGKGDSKALAAKTANVKPLNPHESRHYGTEAECALCHRNHEPSVNFCLDCHPRFNFKVK